MAKIKIKNKPMAKSSTGSSKKQVQVGKNIRISQAQHDNLVKYLKNRLDFGKNARSLRLERYRQIDKELAGYIVLDEDDKKRQMDNKAGLGPKVHDVNLQLTAAQMDEAVTFFTTVFFPEEGPYNAVTHPDKEQVAKGFSRLMNQQSDYFGHFPNFAKGCFGGLKYNQGMWLIEWQKVMGSVIKNGAASVGAEVVDNQVVAQGNKMEALDIYNTLLDPSVHPTELHEKGEFFATVETETAFKAQLMAENEQIFGIERIIDSDGRLKANVNAEMKYYEVKPEIHGDSQSGEAGRGTDWIKFFSGNTAGTVGKPIEKVNMYVWIRPNDHGLSKVPVYQIWRITLLNMQVVAAEQMTNAHGFLPFVATVPWDDNFGIDANSYAEMLLPYQRFSSFQLNVHQRAARKALYNLIIYDEKTIPQMKNADVLGGKVPFRASADVKDMKSAFTSLSDVPDTQNTLQDIENMDLIMQKILPTDILKQVASLERATQYQAAATVQGANRRNLKIAKTIEAQAFSPSKKIQMYNILQYQDSVTILDETGNEMEIDPSALREANLEFTISAGLRGLDKLILLETIKDILNTLVQNPQAAAEFDIAAIIDYVTTLIGDHTSFAAFRFENEFDKMTPEQKQQAFGLLQQALNAQSNAQGGAAGQTTNLQIAGQT